MSSVKAKVVNRAVRTTARHSAHGAASKLRRKPLRSVTLLALGGTVGAALGWMLGHRLSGVAEG